MKDERIALEIKKFTQILEEYIYINHVYTIIKGRFELKLVTKITNKFSLYLFKTISII